MWLAHHFPGLGYTFEDVGRLTPEVTSAMRKVGVEVLLDEDKLRLEHTKLIAQASGARIV